jgi:hypothetical protein
MKFLSDAICACDKRTAQMALLFEDKRLQDCFSYRAFY